MVPLDGSELAECVIPHAETIVEGLKGCRVTLIRVVTPLHLYGSLESRFSPEERKRLEKDSMDVTKDYLDRLRQRMKDKGIEAESVVMFGKNAIDELIDYADNNEVDLIVIATHGRSGVGRWVWGSVADRILRSASVPVLMVRPQDKSQT